VQTHDLVQGSPEWDTFRLNHFGASEAAAMLGISTRVKRSELLHMKHTGNAKEFSDWVQKNILDYGHEVEALARPLVEQMIGEDLYPVTCSNGGRLSASCDGLTMGEDIAFEHKQWNAELAASVASGILPEEYMPQCQQILLVTGARRLIFVVSDGTRSNMAFLWVTPDLGWHERLAAGWAQFQKDLESYVPPDVPVEAVGRTPETLPALRIEVTGMVTASNLTQFKEHALAVFGGINRTLKTDQDFADAEKTVKWCGDIEERLKAAKAHALSQTETIDALFRAIDDITDVARSTRLELDKLVKARKEQVRSEILKEGVDALHAHIASLNERIGRPYMPLIPADFVSAMRGKKTVASLRDAVATTLANAKIEANALADRIDVNLKALIEQSEGYSFLFPDIPQLVRKAPEDCRAVVTARISEHKVAEQRRLDAERDRIAEEERQKAEARIRAEQQAAATTQVVQQKEVTIPFSPVNMPLHAAAQVSHAPAQARTPTLRLGQISERLGFVVTADFLGTLGFPPAATDKSAKLFHEADFPRICNAIAQHALAVGRRVAELEPA
jgi:predicted phage-related endonuclease